MCRHIDDDIPSFQNLCTTIVIDFSYKVDIFEMITLKSMAKKTPSEPLEYS